jgi:hypothetical protein
MRRVGGPGRKGSVGRVPSLSAVFVGRVPSRGTVSVGRVPHAARTYDVGYSSLLDPLDGDYLGHSAKRLARLKLLRGFPLGRLFPSMGTRPADVRILAR